MKKILVLTLLLLVSIFTVACSKKELTLPERIYKEYPTNINKGVEVIMKEENYTSVEYDEQVKLMKELLELYKVNGEIKTYHYEKTSNLYSFTYKDNTLGGVMLKPFDPMLY